MTSQLASPTLSDLVVTTQWLPLHLSSSEAIAVHNIMCMQLSERSESRASESTGISTSVCEGSVPESSMYTCTDNLITDHSSTLLQCSQALSNSASGYCSVHVCILDGGFVC